MFRFARAVLVTFLAVLLVGSCVSASELTAHYSGVLLSDVGDYDWWYGCSPTSAGMMLSGYDRDGSNPNIVPGVTADLSTFVHGSNYDETVAMIASPGNIADFYVNGYYASGDDVAQPWHSFDSLADFMGTSQDSVGNVNGGTTFWFYTNGMPLTYTDIFSYGPSYWGSDGMYGIYEYLDYAGYENEVVSLYSQYIDAVSPTNGFTFEEYMAEIDAERPVIIQVDGHSMTGIGYNAATETVYLHDTWSAGVHSMTWGGSYSGMSQYGVCVLQLEPGDFNNPVPAPAALMSLCTGLALLGGYRLRRKQ